MGPGSPDFHGALKTRVNALFRSIRATGSRLFLLKFDPLVGALEIDMERLAQAV
jgi:hypothetical protein